jgi:phospholipid N-methyltransferase
MKILEVGAGTGGITRHMLNSLMLPKGDNEFMTPLYSSYDFTDISRSFFAEAEAKFAHHGSRLNFKILDIDEDPEIQGFENGNYDMVIAASVSYISQQVPPSKS